MRALCTVKMCSPRPKTGDILARTAHNNALFVVPDFRYTGQNALGYTHFPSNLFNRLVRLPPAESRRGLNRESQCCSTSTENMRLIRDGHLDFHTAPEL